MRTISGRGAVILWMLLFTWNLSLSAAEPNWIKRFDKKIEWQKLTDAGYLVVGTKEALFGLDPQSGDIVWQLDQFKKMPADFLEVIPGTQFAVITYKGGSFGFGTTSYLVNIIKGEILWDTGKLDLGNSFGQFYVPQLGGLMVFGTNPKAVKELHLVDLATGDPIWAQREIYKKVNPPLFAISEEKKLRVAIMGNQEPLLTPDGNFLELISTAGLRKINGKTGELIWTSKLKIKTVPAPRHGYASMTLSEDGKVVYVPHANRLHAVRVEDGSLLWEKPRKLKGAVQQIAVTDQGIVCKGGWGAGLKKFKDFIVTLDPATGEQTWRKPFKDLDNATSFAVKDGRIFLYADRSLFAIDIKSGGVEELAKKIKLGDKEVPHTLELRDNGLLLRSSQNLMLFDFKGKEVYHAYNKSPQASLLAKVASSAVLMAVNAGSAANAYNRAYATGNDQSYSLITSNPVMSERFSETTNSRNFVYMLSVVGKGSHKKGAGVIQVDKVTGTNAKSIVLGTKKPDYELDEIGGRLFFRPNDKEIHCYKF